MSLRMGLLVLLFASAVVVEGAAECAVLTRIQEFIANSWTVLRRSNAQLVKAAADDKVKGNDRVVLYVPRDSPQDVIADQLRHDLSAEEFQRVSLVPLPEHGEPDQPGLLYLPHPYVVPGGRFNEMYGWDSYFILLGLLEDGRLDLARDMTANLIYEIDHYGKVLNANRSYYLTRSQPPFLTEMILEIFQRTRDKAWLKSTLPAIERYYSYWTTEPHLTPETGLSRWDGGADTPAPEVITGEEDSKGRNDYARVREYYRKHKVSEYDLARFYDRRDDRLTPLFYRADRAMRESGLDPSGRFGPFSAAILNFNPVDLNTLLCRMEMDISRIYTLLGQTPDAELWARRAKDRAAAINRLMWDEPAGQYFDYDFVNHRPSGYAFLTTFYPLWAGIASPRQAARVEAKLSLFERGGGLQTSTKVTGDQWDAPFGWAPLQLLAVEGLRRYGFNQDADRISVKFLSMVVRDFSRYGTIKEKYDVVAERSDLAASLRFGYSTNEIGFGWTNAVFLILHRALSSQGKDQLTQSCAGSKP